ncbi:hypothetical protein C1645_870401, partial [Glomus cerebriforme]
MNRLNLTLIVIIIFVTFSLPCQTFNTTSFKENNPIDSVSSRGINSDGVMLFTVQFQNDYPNITNFRLIYPNGSIILINHVEVPCDSCTYSPCLIKQNYILINYEGSNQNLLGMIIDLTGNIISKNISFGEYDQYSTDQNNDDVFLVARSIRNKNRKLKSNQILLDEYIFNNYGQIGRKISKNLIFNKNHGIKITKLRVFLLTDARKIIFGNDKNDFSLIIHAKSQNKTLHQQPLELGNIAQIFEIKCISIQKESIIDHYCLYLNSTYETLKLLHISNLTLNNTFIATSTELLPSIGFDINMFHIHTMPDVGFLVESLLKLQTKYFIFNVAEIDYFDQTNAFGEVLTDNNFTNNSLYGNNIFLFPNNIIVRIIRDRRLFTFQQMDLSSIIPKNNPYNNTHIKQVYPSMNDLIYIGTNEMNITFLNQIDPTTAVNISIYLIHDNDYYLRQKFLCTNPYCIISDDFYSLKINLLSNPFNIPNASYYVEIDDDFVEYKYEHIKVPGIKPGNWIINTLPGNYSQDTNNQDSDYILGKLRLNSDGTEQYNLLDVNGQNDFFEQMTSELSKSIPVDISRIHKIKNIYEYDMIENSKLLSIIFKIDSPKENCFNKNSSNAVIDDLNTLIQINSDITTSLDINNYTKYIDKEYRFQKTFDLWGAIKISLQNFVLDSE